MQRQEGLCVSFILLVVLGLTVSSAAQTETATLSGRVTDPSGAIVPGARVEVINIATNITATTETNAQGIYVVPNLRPGRYRIVVRKEGFKQVVKPGVVLNVQDIISHNFALEVGSVVQSVTVLAETGRMATSPAVSTVIDRQFAENLPLNGRSFQQLITLTPGVVLTKASSGNEGQFSVNGQRANSNYFTVDGVSANFGIPPAVATGISAGGTLPAFSVAGGTNSLVSVDAMQEFRIQTSTYAPEFGRSPGGQISIVTRSGSNDFHGTLFNYFRNDKLDANDWFANANGVPKPPLRQNDFGGVLGGPIVPDKTFFFFSYEGLRLRQPQVRVIAVPSVASRQAAVPGVRPFLDAYPLPNGPDLGGGWAQFTGSFSDEITLDATSIRVDHTFNEKVTIFGRYNHAPSDSATRTNNLSTRTVNSLKIQTLTLGTTQIFTPSVSNEFRVNLSRAKGSASIKLTDFGGAIPPSDSVLFPSFTSSNKAREIFQIAGGSSLLAGTSGANQQRQANFVDNLSVIVGGHLLKLGMDYRWLSPIDGGQEYDQNIRFDGLTGPNGALAGIIDRGTIRSIRTVASVFTNFSAYAQDTWQVTPRLTLTYGLRWDVIPPPHGKNGKELFAVDQIDDLATMTLAPAGTPLYDTTYDYFAPRVGVAYQLSQRPGRETVLRGGFGLFYDLGAARSAGDASFVFPHGATKSISGVPFPLDSANAAPPPFPDPSGPLVSVQSVGFDPDLKLPRTYQWNLTLEQSLGSHQTLSAAYVGAVGRRLLRREVLLFPNPSFLTVWIGRNAATSDYHALQVQFKRRLSRGLQALASYTYSHSIDIASEDSGIPAAVGFADPSIDRASSNFDVRHSFSAAATYNISSPAKSGVGSGLLRDWSIDTIVTARSATPVDLTAGFNLIPFLFSRRPDLIPDVPLYVDDPTVAGGRAFNPAAFTPAPSGQQGTLGRNVLRGFRMSQVDFALRRQFSLSEKLNLQFRAEFFNLFNHPNFGDPNPSIFSGLFGQSTQMLGRSLGTGGTSGGAGFNSVYQVGGPRSMQFALKLVF